MGCRYQPPPRLRYSGVRHLAVNIRSRLAQCASATQLCCRCLLCVTSGSVDADVTMRAHVTATVRVCFAALRQIRSVRRSVTHDALLTLLRSLVITKLDFGGSALTGVSGSLMQRLQSVLNAAARLVFSARRSEHTTPLLRELHWLKVPERIQYRLCVLTHRCLHGTAPSYLAETLHLTTEVDARSRLRSASASTPIVPSTR